MADSRYVFEVTHATFSEMVLESSRRVPVLVDFWADWCAPCHMLVPVLAKLADEYQGKFVVAKVNTDQEQELAAQYAVRSLPTVKLFRNGEVVDEFMGALPEGPIRELLERHVLRESDAVRLEAIEAHERGDSDKALAMLHEARAQDPDNHRVVVDLARVLMDRSEFSEAESLLRSMPLSTQMEPAITALLSRLEFAATAREAASPETLEQRITEDPADIEARYQLSAHQVLAGSYEQALQQLLEILRRDRSFRDDAARRAMVAIFEILGNEGPLVGRYRTLMAQALY